MQSKKVKTIIAIVLTLIMVFSLIASVLPMMAHAVTQEEIDELKARRDAITAQKDAQQAIVDELEAQQAGFLEQKTALDERNAYTIQQMLLNQDEINLYSQMIEEKALELEAAKQAEHEQLVRYRTRVRAMEENGGYNILSLILQSSNLAQLLTSIDDMGEIMERDRALEDAYIQARENTENVKAEYEQTKTELEARQVELQAQQQQLQRELDEATELLNAVTAELGEKASILAELENAEDEASDAVSAKVKELEAQRAAEEAARRPAGGGGGGSSSGGGTASGGVVGSGSFSWPCSCTYITSCVGYRYHPVTGVWKYHAGMDIGCSYGDTVWASDGGTVVIAGVNGGYGNCVMIDHGNGYYTLYGHLSSIAVSYGQSVSQGQVVGYVGSTGVSTGPHLHFEIRNSSNESIDFNGWFGGLTYSPDSGGA